MGRRGLIVSKSTGRGRRAVSGRGPRRRRAPGRPTRPGRRGRRRWSSTASARLLLVVQGQLDACPGRRSPRPSSPAGGEPGQPLIARGVDEDDPVAEVVPARLEQDGRVEHDGRGLAAADARSMARSKVLRIRGWRIASRSRRADGLGEDDRGQGPRGRSGAGPRSRVEHLAAEPRDDLVAGRAAGRAGRGRSRRRRAPTPRARPAPRPPGSCRRRCRRPGRGPGPARASTGRGGGGRPAGRRAYAGHVASTSRAQTGRPRRGVGSRMARRRSRSVDGDSGRACAAASRGRSRFAAGAGGSRRRRRRTVGVGRVGTFAGSSRFGLASSRSVGICRPDPGRSSDARAPVAIEGEGGGCGG